MEKVQSAPELVVAQTLLCKEEVLTNCGKELCGMMEEEALEK